MLQVLAGIGFRFSETLMDYTKEELKKEYPLDSRPQIYWIYRAVHGAKYIKAKKQEKVKYLERVTFHPNYSYAQFVGTYKPVQDKENPDLIKYEYVPGPFMRIYVNAVKEQKRAAIKGETPSYFLLLIEEINRANVAAVFGDVFQLLDRDSNGISEYPVAASEDIKNYLSRNGIEEDELSIPSNMYIWATMNSADQGVFPMDTAFKRRWEFEYLGIDDGERNSDGTIYTEFINYKLPIPCNYDKKTKNVTEYKLVSWNKIRHAINDKLKSLSSINEDKLLGPYFLSKTILEAATNASTNEEKEKYNSMFKSKILMYLFEDVCKINPSLLFSNTGIDGRLHYSDICEAFDNKGLSIFGIELEKDSSLGEIKAETESPAQENEQ